LARVLALVLLRFFASRPGFFGALRVGIGPSERSPYSLKCRFSY
jgi:hypothetical protein